MSSNLFNNLAHGRLERTAPEMGLVTTDMPLLLHRDNPPGGPTENPHLVQPFAKHGMYGVQEYRVLGREVTQGDTSRCLDPQSGDRSGKGKVWNITNSRDRRNEFAVAGISLTSHSGEQIPGQDNWITTVVSGLTNVYVDAPVSQGQVLIARQPPPNPNGQDEIGARPLLVEPATPYNTPSGDLFGDKDNFEDDCTTIEAMVESGSTPANYGWIALTNHLNQYDANGEVDAKGSLWLNGADGVRPDLIRCLDMTEPATTTQYTDLLDHLKAFPGLLEQELLQKGRHDTIRILNMLPFAWGTALDEAHLNVTDRNGVPLTQERLATLRQLMSFRLRDSIATIACRAGRNCYSHVVGVAQRDTQANHLCPIFRS